MKFQRTVTALALALSLTACAVGAGDGVSWRFAHWCNTDAAKLVKSADWSKAETINLKFLAKKYDTISIPVPDENRKYTTDRYHRMIGAFEVRTDVFDPQFMKIKKGQPYILKVQNTDAVPRSLAGYDFFTDMAIAKVVNAGKESAKKCIWTVTIPGGSSAEIHFVAAKSGRYELEDNAVILMPGLGPVAFITIE